MDGWIKSEPVAEGDVLLERSCWSKGSREDCTLLFWTNSVCYWCNHTRSACSFEHPLQTTNPTNPLQTVSELLTHNGTSSPTMLFDALRIRWRPLDKTVHLTLLLRTSVSKCNCFASVTSSWTWGTENLPKFTNVCLGLVSKVSRDNDFEYIVPIIRKIARHVSFSFSMFCSYFNLPC